MRNAVYQMSHRLGGGSAPDHTVEFGDDLTSLDKGGSASFDGGDSDRFCLRQRVPSDCHETSDRSGRRDPMKAFDIGRFGPASACRPFADNTKRTSEAPRP